MKIYKASLVNIYNDRAIENAPHCAIDLKLVSVHSGLVVHDVLQDEGK